MTSTLSNTGEIQLPPLPDDPTRDLMFAAHAPLLRRPDATGEIFMPRSLAVPGDQLQPLFPLERVIDPARDESEIDLYRSVPYVFPEGYVYRRRTGAHRPKTVWSRLVAFVARWVSL